MYLIYILCSPLWTYKTTKCMKITLVQSVGHTEEAEVVEIWSIVNKIKNKVPRLLKLRRRLMYHLSNITIYRVIRQS